MKYIDESWILRLQLADSGRDFTYAKTQIAIGRDSNCDLCFPEEKYISRYHAEIFFRSGTWYIVDKVSTGGTWVRGERLTPGQETALREGDVIELVQKVKIIFVEGRQPKGDYVAAPAEKMPMQGFCRACGSPVTGRFCGCCGSLAETAIPSPAAMCAPAPVPSRQHAPSGRPAPPRPAPCTPAPMPAPCAPAPMPSMPVPCAPAPKAAPQKKGLFSKLFGGKEAKEPDPVPASMDDVQFRGTAPERIRAGEYFPVKIMMYREDDYQRADRESAAVADRTKSASSSVFQAAQGQKFRIALQSPDLELDCESQQMSWNGKFAAADFEVFLPENYDRSQLRLRGRVYSDDAVLTDLKLILQIDAAQPQSVVCEKVRLKTAFISYASADRPKVAARIQGIQLARPDMDLFIDVEKLRRGEAWRPRLYQEIADRDLFYLFWSSNAAASEWVLEELRYAMEKKTADYIEPIPLESPDVCPPPQCLNDKHFNDWTLRYLNNH